MLNEDYLMEAAFSQFGVRSKTENPRRLMEECNKVNNPHQMGFQYNSNVMINEEEELDNMIHHGINNLLETQSVNSNKPPHFTTSTTSSVERINPSLKIK